MLLGLKTRIDKTIAGLFQHQMTITQQIVSMIGQQHSTSRMPKTVPRFLRAMTSRLSAGILEKVKKEWERYVNLMEAATCERSSTVSIWKVYCSNQTFTCHGVDWTCTCLFYRSNHLPCRHLMQVAHKEHGFQMLPAISIHERWSTFSALSVKEDLDAAANALQPIVRMSKLGLPNVRLPDDIDEETIAPSSSALKRVAYVRLRRRERAKQVVLSSSEKYSYEKAMIQPLLQHLSSLPSADFYHELNAWKETVELGLRQEKPDDSADVHGTVSDSEGSVCDSNGGKDDGCVSEADVFSILDPADTMETANLMNELETANPEVSTDGGNDGEDIPPTQLAELKQEPPTSLDAVAAPVRQVDIVGVPKPKSKGRSRSTPKQLRQANPTSERLAVHKYPSGLTVSLDQLVVWARNTENMKYVVEMMEQYPVQLEDAYLRGRTIECQWEAVRPAEYMHNFVIPADLTRSMQAATTTARSERRKPDALVGRVKKQDVVLDVVASIDPKLWKFSSQFVHALTGFCAVKAKGRSWFEDRKWLEQDWRKVISSDVQLFAEETNTSGISPDAIRDRHQALANEVISKCTSGRLRTDFFTLSGDGMISFENIVGGLCRGWMNDSPIDFCLETIGASVGNCYMLSSLMWAVGWPYTPKTSLVYTRFIVHPMDLKANHWGIIIARLSFTEATKKVVRVHVYMYEPLIDDEYHEDMETVWEGIAKGENGEKEGLRGFVERWHKALMSNSNIELDPVEWVEAPQQPDGASCGVLVVAHAHRYLTGNGEQPSYNV